MGMVYVVPRPIRRFIEVVGASYVFSGFGRVVALSRDKTLMMVAPTSRVRKFCVEVDNTGRIVSKRVRGFGLDELCRRRAEKRLIRMRLDAVAVVSIGDARNLRKALVEHSGGETSLYVYPRTPALYAAPDGAPAIGVSASVFHREPRYISVTVDTDLLLDALRVAIDVAEDEEQEYLEIGLGWKKPLRVGVGNYTIFVSPVLRSRTITR